MPGHPPPRRGQPGLRGGREKREGSTLPALRSNLVRVGEPKPAAKCRGVFPAKVCLFKSAPSYGERCEAVKVGCLGTAPLPPPHHSKTTGDPLHTSPSALWEAEPHPCPTATNPPALPYLLHQVGGHVQVLHLHGEVQRGPPALSLHRIHVRSLPDQQVQAGQTLCLHGQVHRQEACNRVGGEAQQPSGRAHDGTAGLLPIVSQPRSPWKLGRWSK